jgi:hypothetical protein
VYDVVPEYMVLTQQFVHLQGLVHCCLASEHKHYPVCMVIPVADRESLEVQPYNNQEPDEMSGSHGNASCCTPEAGVHIMIRV